MRGMSANTLSQEAMPLSCARHVEAGASVVDKGTVQPMNANNEYARTPPPGALPAACAAWA